MRSIASVSYTHLDVYKRQALAYAYVIESTAPGQMSLEELSAARELLKW